MPDTCRGFHNIIECRVKRGSRGAGQGEARTSAACALGRALKLVGLLPLNGLFVRRRQARRATSRQRGVSRRLVRPASAAADGRPLPDARAAAPSRPTARSRPARSARQRSRREVRLDIFSVVCASCSIRSNDLDVFLQLERSRDVPPPDRARSFGKPPRRTARVGTRFPNWRRLLVR